MRRVALAVLGLLTFVASSTATSASAEVLRERKEVRQDSAGNATVTVRSHTETAGSRRSSGGTVACGIYEISGDVSGEEAFADPGELEEGQYYWASCVDTATGDLVSSRYFVHEPGSPAVSGLALARSAVSSMTLGFPSPRTNPDVDHRQLPGIETWLWIETDDWRPLSATADIPGLSATVTATPTSVSWDMGDGSPPVVCEGPGTAYDPDRPPAEQSSDCTHRYQDRGSYTATATVRWELAWSASDGDGGTLAPAERSTTFPMTVAERQAVGT